MSRRRLLNCTALVIVVALGAVHGLSASAAAVGPNLSYMMMTNEADIAAHRAHIRLALSDMRSSTLTLTMHAYHGRYPIPILNFTSSSKTGQMLPSTEYYRDKDRYWTVQTQGLSNLTVDYDIVFGTIRGNYNQHLGFLGNDFGMSMAEWVFLIPCDMSPSSVGVEFQLPTGWKAFAPWRRGGDVFYPSSLEYLATSTFALGNFDSYSKEIGRTEVSIAVYSGWSAFAHDRLVETAFRIFEYQTSLFGESVGEEYLAVFSPLADDGKWIWGGEYSQSQGLSVGSPPEDPRYFVWAMQQFSHQIFHRWNAWEPYGMGVGEEVQWFSEGADVYYESKVLVELGIMKEYSDLRNVYSEYLANFFNTSRDMPLAMAGKYHRPEEETSAEFIMYRKGALTCLLLDVSILEVTNRDRDLGLLLRKLYELHGHMKGSYSNAEILRELGKIADYPFADFFKRYIHGTERLPLDELFTRLSLLTSKELLKVGDGLELAARLTDYHGRPISSETVRFYVDLALIATAVTDSRGEARAVYVVNSTGRIEVEAWYPGAGDYTRLPSSQSLSITVERAEARTAIQTSVTGIARTPIAVVTHWLDFALPYLALAAVLLAMVLILPRFRKKS